MKGKFILRPIAKMCKNYIKLSIILETIKIRFSKIAMSKEAGNQTSYTVLIQLAPFPMTDFG